MMARACVLLALAAFAGGCETVRTVEIPRELRIPVPVPCITQPVERPAFITDRELAAADDYTLVIELARDRLKRRQYEVKLEAQLAGCL